MTRHWPNARNLPTSRCSIDLDTDRRSRARATPRSARRCWRRQRRRQRPSTSPLHEAAQSRYLNYALSVITSRALPDVRDGLKPVQRRILYTMWQQNLTADAKHRKCAKVVGDVMGSYHPHGDAALYETLVRMAQSFSLRYPLVDGSGNFGSLDGDSAAAMRYTECRLARISDEMLTEIEQATVPFRPNYDGTKTEPVVLPARIPNLLVNGATGIAVGMATNIPPHNLGEVCTALVKLLDNEDLSSAQLCRYVKGPDFPTGGQILNSPDELKEIYKTGSGIDPAARHLGHRARRRARPRPIYIDSIPYTVNKSQLVERIADVVLGRKLPPLLDVKDLSTDDVRIAIEMKKDADEKMVMAYLFKHTPLQINFAVNLTCLIPTENPEVGRPERLDLKQILWHFLHFRLEVVTKRLEHELAALKKRIHILEGFEKVFDALDEIIRIIRKSDGKADAAEKIMKRFELDAEQTDAILELKIYRLARLEILIIRKELDEKRKRARQIAALLKDEDSRWKLVRAELEEIQQKYGDKRRTRDRQRHRRARIHRRRLHRRGRQRRHRVARRLGEAAEGSEGSVDDAAARGRRGAGGLRRQHARDLRVLHATSASPTPPDHRRAGVDRLRRADPAAVQAEGRREDRRGDQPRSRAVDRRRSSPKQRKATPRRRCTPSRVTSDGYACASASSRSSSRARAPAAASRGRRRARRWSASRGSPASEILIAATAEARGMLCQADEVNYLSGPGQGRDPDQARRRRPRARLHRLDRRPRSADGRDHPRRRADDQHRQIRGDRPRRQGTRAAAARPVHPDRLADAGGARRRSD